MDQQQFKVRMSVATKLLMIIFFLTAAPVAFLSYSAITMFRSDKKAHVYDSQAAEAVLVGREFVSYLNNSLDILKNIARSVELAQPITDFAENSVLTSLQKQNIIIGVELHSLDLATWQNKLLHKQILPTSTQTPQFELQNTVEQKDLLETRGFFFKNISVEGQPPMLAMVLIDVARLQTQGTLPLLVGYISMAHFVAEARSAANRFIVADRKGDLLFHTDAKALSDKKNILNDDAFKAAWANPATFGNEEYNAPDSTLKISSFYKPGLDLIAFAQIDYDRAMVSTDIFVKKFILLEIASLLVTLILAWLFSKKIMAPLNQLLTATTMVSEGKFNVDIPVSSSDEFGALAASFATMSKRISELMQEQMAKLRVGTELEIAKTVQQSLFPAKRLKNEHLSLYSEFQSALECGGDWLGYFRTHNKYTIVVADATGHGLPSALMTAAARACFSVIEKFMSDPNVVLNPAQMLKLANRVVYDSAHGKIMMTCYVCVLDFDARTITYSSAGHNPAWLFRKDDTGAVKLTSLITTGARLGEAQEITTEFEEYRIPLQINDTLVFYTDGILDAKNEAGDAFGKRRLRKAIEGAINEDPKTIITDLILEFYTHTLNKPLDDDVTISVARILS